MAFSLTCADREIIRRQLRDDGSTALWFYAPGVLAPDAGSPTEAYGVQNIAELTGIRVIEREGDRSPAMRPLPGHPFCEGVPESTLIAPDDIIANWGTRDEKFQFRQMTYPPRKELFPLFAVQDPDADVFGHYAETGEPAMAVKQDDGFCSIFVGGLTLPAQLFANIARSVGVHLYCAPGDVVYADGQVLSITACSPGRKTVHLPAPAQITDVYSEATIGCGVRFDVDLCLGETRIFRITRVSG